MADINVISEEEMRSWVWEKTMKLQSIDVTREFEFIRIFQAKWQSRVIFELAEKSPRRFGELVREVPGISNAVLSNVLRTLIDKGIVVRKQFNEIPPHVEYSLTEKGSAFLPVFYELIRWETQWCPETFEK